MHDTPQEVQLSLAEFDRRQLPESQRALQGDAFRQAVQQHLAAQFIGGQGAAEVVVTADRIIIRWTASTEAKTLMERGVDTLKQGDYDSREKLHPIWHGPQRVRKLIGEGWLLARTNCSLKRYRPVLT